MHQKSAHGPPGQQLARWRVVSSNRGLFPALPGEPPPTKLQGSISIHLLIGHTGEDGLYMQFFLKAQLKDLE